MLGCCNISPQLQLAEAIKLHGFAISTNIREPVRSDLESAVRGRAGLSNGNGCEGTIQGNGDAGKGEGMQEPELLERKE